MDRCQSKCGSLQCELPAGHKYKHVNGGNFWSDQGAARVNRELAEKVKHGKED